MGAMEGNETPRRFHPGWSASFSMGIASASRAPRKREDAVGYAEQAGSKLSAAADLSPTLTR